MLPFCRTPYRNWDVNSLEVVEIISQARGALDLHSDTPKLISSFGYDVSKPHHQLAGSLSQWDIPRAREGGLGGQFFGLWTLPYPQAGSANSVIEQINVVYVATATNPRTLVLCRSREGWLRARQNNQIAIFLGLEGAHALEGKLENVSVFAKRGVRYLGVGHFTANECCHSAGPFGGNKKVGLTSFGYDVLDACVVNGVIPDLAHLNHRGFLEATRHALARRLGPLIVSHTGLTGIQPHWRNIDDQQIRAIADSGGVVGIINSSHFLGGKDLEAMIRNFDHLRKVGGDDVLALGSDHDGFARAVRGYRHVGELPNLVQGFILHGFSPELIVKILSGNALRVLAAVPPRH